MARIASMPGHGLDATLVLNCHFPWNQKNKQFQEDSGLLLHYLVDRLAAPLPEGGVHFLDSVGVERLTCATRRAARVPVRTSPTPHAGGAGPSLERGGVCAPLTLVA